MNGFKRRAFLCVGTSSLLNAASTTNAAPQTTPPAPLLKVLGTSGWDLRILAYTGDARIEAIREGKICVVWEREVQTRVLLEVPKTSLELFLEGLHPENVWFGSPFWGVRVIQENRVLQGVMTVRKPDLRIDISPVLQDITLHPGDCVAIGPLHGRRM